MLGQTVTRAIFEKLKVKLLTFTVYYLQSDKQSEKMNQFIKIKLHYFLTKNSGEK